MKILIVTIITMKKLTIEDQTFKIVKQAQLAPFNLKGCNIINPKLIQAILVLWETYLILNQV